MRTVILVTGEELGSAEPALGRRVLRTFLQKLGRLQGLDAILLVNAGVKLAANGSEVLGELASLAERGVDVLPCQTCVEHFGLAGSMAVGTVSTMDDLVKRLDQAAKVITI